MMLNPQGMSCDCILRLESWILCTLWDILYNIIMLSNNKMNKNKNKKSVGVKKEMLVCYAVWAINCSQPVQPVIRTWMMSDDGRPSDEWWRASQWWVMTGVPMMSDDGRPSDEWWQASQWWVMTGVPVISDDGRPSDEWWRASQWWVLTGVPVMSDDWRPNDEWWRASQTKAIARRRTYHPVICGPVS